MFSGSYDLDRASFESFIRERCYTYDKTSEMEARELYNEFIRWWGDIPGQTRHWLTKQKFMWFANATFKAGKKSYQKTYRGVRVKKDGE